MLPTVIFVEGRLSSNAQYTSLQATTKASSSTSYHKTRDGQDGRYDPKTTRSKTQEPAASVKPSTFLPQLSSKSKEETMPRVRPSTTSSIPPWVERNYEIPTRMGPYSLSCYARSNPVAVLEDYRLATKQRLMAIRTCVRCPAREARNRHQSNDAAASSVQPLPAKPRRSKSVAPTADTSPPPSPPNLFPSYRVGACPKHPARRKTNTS